MSDSSALSYSFSGHQSFALRYAWLPKVVHHLQQESRLNLFARQDALVLLGVGKNMVQSMRHWSRVLGISERDDNQERLTELGKRVFGRDGWDPYLEDPGTLWLLHWQLASKPDKASTWFLAFTQWNAESFTRNDLIDWLIKQAQSQPGTRATRGSIKRDVDVFIRTYTPSVVTATRPPEETFDSPFVELGLIREVGRDTYAFVRDEKPTLPNEVLIYALMDYWLADATAQQTLSFERLLHGRGSPGAAFKLTENALVARLEQLPAWTGMRFDDTAGVRQLLRQSDILEPIGALSRYYDHSVESDHSL